MNKRDLLSLAVMSLSLGLSSCCRNCNDQSISKDCPCETNGDPCSSMTCDEMYFANLLTSKNRIAFCSRFSAEERHAVMMASCNGAINCGADRNAGKKVMKPDDAVSEIMRSNNMTMEEKRDLLLHEENSVQ